MSFLKVELEDCVDELIQLIFYGDVDLLGEEVVRNEVMMIVKVAMDYQKELSNK